MGVLLTHLTLWRDDLNAIRHYLRLWVLDLKPNENSVLHHVKSLDDCHGSLHINRLANHIHVWKVEDGKLVVACRAYDVLAFIRSATFCKLNTTHLDLVAHFEVEVN